MKQQNLLEKFLPSANDSWAWNYAEIQDINDMVALSRTYMSDADTYFTVNELAGKFNLDLAITKQRHNLASDQLIVCRDKNTGILMAWAWIVRGKTVPFSSDEMAEANMAHIDLTIPLRTRVKLFAQILYYWEMWARACRIPIIISSSLRMDNEGFTNLHERAGYQVRGGIAVKRLDNE